MRTSDIDSIKAKYQIVGQDERLNLAIDTALQVAHTDLSVLIQGESGVGKEVLPRIIHDYSPRKNKRYIAINCGSIPEGTIDSELFGHVKGSFTGALADHDGYFAAANGGTLFLDEVGELPLSTQARLLRVLETGEYIRVGSNEPQKTNVRIVAATNVQMQRAISEGRFREDLYFRLCTISIKVPPLRDRGSDVIRLFKKFAMDTAAKYNIPMPLRLTPEAEQVMMSYKWPGNIRQLRNLAEQMSILCKDNRIVTPSVLHEYDIVPNGSSTEMTFTGNASTGQYDYSKERAIIFAMLNQLASDVKALKDGVHTVRPADHFAHAPLLEAPADIAISDVAMTDVTMHDAAMSSVSMPDAAMTSVAMPDVAMSSVSMPDVKETTSRFVDDETYDAEFVDADSDLNLERMEKKAIEEALRRNHNRRKLAAVDLGISERTLYRKIKDYGLEE